MRKIILLALLLLCMGLQVSAQYRLDSNEVHAKSFQGKKLPAFSVQEWMTKKPDVRGKYQLIDFWGIFAYPCTSITVPQLNKLAKTFAKEVVVIGYSIDDPFYIRQIEDPVFRYPIASVDQEEIIKLFEFEGLPVTMLINPKGEVIWQGAVLIPNVPFSQKEDIFFLTEAKLREMIDTDKNKVKE